MKKLRITITGVSGYIGSRLALVLSQSGHKITGVSRDPNRIPQKVKSALAQTENADYGSSTFWMDRIQNADAIVHLACSTDLAHAQLKPQENWSAQVLPALSFLDAANLCGKSTPLPRFIFASTSTVLGLTPRDAVPTDHRPAPISVYDAHKLVSEELLIHAYPKTVVLRLANVFGESEVSASGNRGVINRLCNQAARGETLKIFGSGDWIRDYIALDDVIQAFCKVIQSQDNQVAGKAFFVCSGKGRAFKEAVATIAELTRSTLGRTPEIEHVEACLHPIEERNFVGDPSALIQNCDWHPQAVFETEISRLLTNARVQ